MSNLRILAVLLLLATIGSFAGYRFAQAAPQTQAQDCTQLQSPTQIPSPGLINFDDLANATVIGDSYRPAFGVRFEDVRTTQAIIYGNEPAKAHSQPNVASNNAIFPSTSVDVPLRITFDAPKTHVGFYMGNGETVQPTALLTAYNVAGGIICQKRFVSVPEPITAFFGINDPTGSISVVTLDYGSTALSEAIDDLYFAPYSACDKYAYSDGNCDGYPYPYTYAHGDAYSDSGADRTAPRGAALQAYREVRAGAVPCRSVHLRH